jgi:hypothetical protein
VVSPIDNKQRKLNKRKSSISKISRTLIHAHGARFVLLFVALLRVPNGAPLRSPSSLATRATISRIFSWSAARAVTLERCASSHGNGASILCLRTAGQTMGGHIKAQVLNRQIPLRCLDRWAPGNQGKLVWRHTVLTCLFLELADIKWRAGDILLRIQSFKTVNFSEFWSEGKGNSSK